MGTPKKASNQPKQKRPPARTVGARENQLINLAVDLAEKQLSEGKASAQVITHFLRLGTTLAILEREKLKQETELLTAKTKSIQDGKRTEELYSNAISAMRMYNGQEMDDQDAGDE